MTKIFDLTKYFTIEQHLAECYINLDFDNIIYTINESIYYFADNKWTKLNNIKSNMISLVYNTLYNHFLKQYSIEKDKPKINSNSEKIKIFLKYICTHSKIVDISKKVICLLYNFKKDIIFDKNEKQKYNINFRNGIFEINTKKFRPRTKQDYVTEVLDWDYLEDKNDFVYEYKDVCQIFKKIHPKEIDYKMALSYLAYCLTGETKFHAFKMNIGYSASNGKSTEIKIHQQCFDIYTDKLDKNCFTIGFNKRHKEFHRLLSKPIRLCYIEELDQNRLDVDCIKSFVDGTQLDVEQLFGTKLKGTNESKFLTTSNKDFNTIDSDQGFARRGFVQYYKSRFTKECKIDDIKTNNYKIDYNLNSKFDCYKYKNAYFQLLLENYNEILEIPQIFKDNFTNINEQYDDFSSYLFEKFEKNKDSFVTKSKLTYYFSDKKIKWSRILTNLKKLGFTYDKDKMVNRTKGVIHGLTEIIDHSDDDSDEE